MEDVKAWYLSRTVWASLIGMATAVGGLVGVPLGGLDNAALTDAVLQAITALAALTAIFGRVRAVTRIG
jgi:small basic protein